MIPALIKSSTVNHVEYMRTDFANRWGDPTDIAVCMVKEMGTAAVELNWAVQACQKTWTEKSDNDCKTEMLFTAE